MLYTKPKAYGWANNQATKTLPLRFHDFCCVLPITTTTKKGEKGHTGNKIEKGHIEDLSYFLIYGCI